MLVGLRPAYFQSRPGVPLMPDWPAVDAPPAVACIAQKKKHMITHPTSSHTHGIEEEVPHSTIHSMMF